MVRGFEFHLNPSTGRNYYPIIHRLPLRLIKQSHSLILLKIVLLVWMNLKLTIFDLGGRKFGAHLISSILIIGGMKYLSLITLDPFGGEESRYLKVALTFWS